MSENWFMRSPGVLSRTVGNDILLAAPTRENVDRISGTGKAIWILLANPRTLPALTVALADLYHTRRNEIAPEVGRFLQDLVNRGWLERIADGDD